MDNLAHPLLSNVDEYEKGGAVYTIPGIIYQVKVTVMLAKWAIDNKYDFKIAAERTDALNFDDLEIIIANTHKHTLCQLKHVETSDEKNKIRKSDLLNEKNGKFSMPKYFVSVRDIHTTSKPFEPTKEFAIFTNASLCTDIEANFQIIEKYDFIDFKSFKMTKDPKYCKKMPNKGKKQKEPTFCKIIPDSDLSKKLVSTLQNYSNIEQLKLILTKCIEENEPIDFKDKILKKYQQALLTIVFNENGDGFNCDFLNSGSHLSSGGKALSEHLMSKFGNALFEKKLIIKKCISLRENPKDQQNGEDLPCDHNIDKEIFDFLDNLVFAVDQPNENELSKIIECSMGKDIDFNLLDCEFVANTVLTEFLNWMKNKKGSFINPENGQAMLKVVKDKLSKLYLVGPTLDNCQNLVATNLKFQAKFQAFEKFLDPDTSEKIFLLINPVSTTLSSLKVHNTLKESTSYDKADSFIFVPFKTLSNLRPHVFNASSNLLIIEFSDDDLIDETFLRDLLNLNGNNKEQKKVLIMTESKFNQLNLLRQTNAKPIEFHDKINSLNDLTFAAQESFVKDKYFSFQGSKVPLNELINDRLKDYVDAEILLKLLQNQQLEIGSRLPELGDIKKYFVIRQFCRIIISGPRLKKSSEFIVLYNSSSATDINLESELDILLISEKESDFKELCSQFKDRNIHWVLRNGDENLDIMLRWVTSYGTTLAKLREVNVTSNEGCTNKFDLTMITQLEHKIVIIAAPPGMGKSTELTNLGLLLKAKEPQTWILRINLGECTKLLDKHKDTKAFDNNTAKHFLYKCSLSHLSTENRFNLLENKYFYQCFDSGRMKILIDAYDECTPMYKDVVIKLLKALKKSPVKRIWVTTRTFGILTDLENELMTFAHTFEPLTDDNITFILKAMWQGNERAKVERYVSTLKRRFFESTNDALPTFLSNPLSLKICAIVFSKAFASQENNFNTYLNGKSIEEINLAELYHEFFNILFDEVYIKDKLKFLHDNKTDFLANKIIGQERDSAIELHKKLALYLMFDPNQFSELLPGQLIDKDLKEIQFGENKVGIIDRIFNNKPEFVHRTYAEYFAALWMAEQSYSKMLQFKSILESILLNDQFLTVKRFFWFLLVKNKSFCNKYPLYSNILHNDVQKFQCFLDNIEGTESLKTKNEIFDLTPLEFALQLQHWNIVELMLKSGFEPDEVINFPEGFIFLAAKAALRYVLEYLMKTTNFDVNATNNEKETVLCIAIRYNSFQIVQYLVGIENIDINSPMFIAIATKNLKMVKFLLQTGKIDTSLDKIQGFVYRAIHDNSFEIIKYFVEEVNAAVLRTGSALRTAVRENKLEFVKYFIEKCDFAKNTQNSSGQSALHIAADILVYDILVFLVETANVDVNILTKKNETVLHLASKRYAGAKIVDYLVRTQRIDINCQDNQGFTALHNAVAKRVLPTIKILLEEPKMVGSLRTNEGKTLLHIAGEYNPNLVFFTRANDDVYLEVLEYIISKNVIDINAQDDNGQTVLHIASLRVDNLKSVKFLVEETAIDINIEDKQGKTASSVAQENNASLIVEYFQEQELKSQFRLRLVGQYLLTYPGAV